MLIPAGMLIHASTMLMIAKC